MNLSISRKLVYVFLIPLMLVKSFKVDAKPMNNNPDKDKIIMQYAGDIGKYSAGVGRQLNKYYSFSLHYGVVPKTEIQSKIETYALKNNLHLYQIEYKRFLLDLYTGVTLYHAPGDKYKTQELSGIDNGYYRQSSIRGMLFLGNELSYRNKVSFYTESGINDIWIINSTNNDSIDYKDHVSLGMGFKYRFN